ncbi:hypothetical protein [Saccharibacillus qingshengii]|uniref:hypothetical protein n=1 Tax=Saccharibacillus qingshengii TaxID=1763540 RepID=UPI0015531D7D|nr:hypothetical protein [Saccharibacillus qingshengii]
MKKKVLLTLLLAAAVPLAGLSPLPASTPSAQAASAKQSLRLPSGASYYGEVKNGQPNGRGTIKWSAGKQYSGDFHAGKRSGTGKYVNTYTDPKTSLLHRVVYDGIWSGDRMHGRGVWTEKISVPGGGVYSNGIRTGVFAENELIRGYRVVHAQADPDYSFSYLSPNFRLDVLGSNVSPLQDWKNGTLFDVRYRKGSVSRNYSLFQGETAAKEKHRLASLRYLLGVTDEVSPYLRQFRALSRQLPLK